MNIIFEFWLWALPSWPLSLLSFAERRERVFLLVFTLSVIINTHLLSRSLMLTRFSPSIIDGDDEASLRLIIVISWWTWTNQWRQSSTVGNFSGVKRLVELNHLLKPSLQPSRCSTLMLPQTTCVRSIGHESVLVVICADPQNKNSRQKKLGPLL